MANDHIAEPIRTILNTFYEISLGGHSEGFRSRFHPDDIDVALGVLTVYLPATLTNDRDYRCVEEAWKHAVLALDAAITRREEAELDRRYDYERGRALEAQVEARHRTQAHRRTAADEVL